MSDRRTKYGCRAWTLPCATATTTGPRCSRRWADHGAITRPRLVEITGLSRSTISDLVSELLAAGAVQEQDGVERSSGRGRPARTLALTAASGIVAGLDYGHSHIHAALATLDGTVLRETRMAQDINDSPDKAISSGVRLLRKLSKAASVSLAEVRCVGVGLPAPVDPATGVITGNNILPNWVDLDPVERFHAALGTPVESRQRRQPRRPGRARRYGRPAGQPHLRQGVDRHRLRDRPQRRDLPRHPRDRRRAGPHPGAERNRPLPLRQPRLPRDGGLPVQDRAGTSPR